MVDQAKDVPQVLILAGTTASGKTDVSIELAQRVNAEIINADSRQVYRELVIGSAPPNVDQQIAIKHHFIATKSLTERWTAGDFAREARQKIAERASKNQLTIVVGGSMLYLRALIDGLYENIDEPFLDYSVLREEWNLRGADAMMTELQQIDPDVAATTSRMDSHRALRAIGHYRATGQRLSDMRRTTTEPLSHEFKLYFLFGDRSETYDRVNRRVDVMLARGLVDEVRDIQAHGFDETNTNALRTHGYQEVFPFLRGEYSYETMRTSIQQAVRHYVKRQLTWFRRDPRAVWVFRSFDEMPISIAERICNDFLGFEKIVDEKRTR